MVSARSTCAGRGVHLLSHGADTIRTICTEGATATHSFHHQLVEMFCPGMHTLHLNYYGYSLYQKKKKNYYGYSTTTPICIAQFVFS